MAEAIIYEVSLEVNPSRTTEFDVWLTEHAQAMLALPGFLDARILQPESAAGGGTVRRVVQYTLASRADLERYLAEDAPRMRAEGTQRFGADLQASRRVLDLQRSVTTAAALQASTHMPAFTTDVPHCRNCGTPLAGKFCVVCGQRNHTYVAPLWEIAEDLARQQLGFDTRFFRSIVPLLFRPGFLTREYCAGREESYIKPFRLYLFSSILVFFLGSFMIPKELGNVNVSNSLTDTQAAKMTAADKQEARQEIARSLELLKLAPGTDKDKLKYQKKLQAEEDILDGKRPAPEQKTTAAAAATGGVNIQVGDDDKSQDNGWNSKFKKAADNPEQFKTQLYQNLPKMMFVLLPIVALLLKLFYIRSKRYYVEHFVFMLHIHAMVFVVMLLFLLLAFSAMHLPWLAPLRDKTGTVMLWYVPIYLFLAMRFFYRQSWLKTALKFFLLLFSYSIAMAMTLVAAVFLTAVEI